VLKYYFYQPVTVGVARGNEQRFLISKLKSQNMSDLEQNVADLEIEESGKKKLTHKEKKKLKKRQDYEKTIEMLTKTGGQGHSELDSNFTVSQRETQNRGPQQLENTVDIKIENFSIAAKGKELFTNATLLIVQSRRYGLVGPNGYVLLFKLLFRKHSLLVKNK
jgi:hypothetical protein